MATGVSKVSPVDIAHALKGIDFPASRRDLVKHAKSHKAGADTVRLMQHLPDQEYRNMADVMKGVGQVE
ncbi:MAG: DUF2795 domain-containing protein [Candidatus Nitrosoglobus sp.]|jgi:hypothetical protein